MEIVLYVCIPSATCEGVFRRARISMFGTKVTSIEFPDYSEDHVSCRHRSTVHYPIPVKEKGGVQLSLRYDTLNGGNTPSLERLS